MKISYERRDCKTVSERIQYEAGSKNYLIVPILNLQVMGKEK